MCFGAATPSKDSTALHWGNTVDSLAACAQTCLGFGVQARMSPVLRPGSPRRDLSVLTWRRTPGLRAGPSLRLLLGMTARQR